jgi:hypothetical protein
MENEDIIFKPHYTSYASLALYGLPLAFLGLLCASASLFPQANPLFWVAMLALGITASLLPFFFVRYILFREKMVVRRYLLPDTYLDYREVQEVDAAVIHTTRGDVRLGRLQNADDLREMVQRWKAVRTLKENQRGPVQAQRFELPVRGYGTYGLMWGLMFGIIAMYLIPASLNLDSRWVLGGALLLTYLIYIYILPRRL